LHKITTNRILELSIKTSTPLDIGMSRIVAFFRNRATNAASESFNAKIKQFRAQLRGVKDISFFLFRLSKIYA